MNARKRFIYIFRVLSNQFRDKRTDVGDSVIVINRGIRHGRAFSIIPFCHLFSSVPTLCREEGCELCIHFFTPSFNLSSQWSRGRLKVHSENNAIFTLVSRSNSTANTTHQCIDLKWKTHKHSSVPASEG